MHGGVRRKEDQAADRVSENCLRASFDSERQFEFEGRGRGWTVNKLSRFGRNDERVVESLIQSSPLPYRGDDSSVTL